MYGGKAHVQSKAMNERSVCVRVCAIYTECVMYSGIAHVQRKCHVQRECPSTAEVPTYRAGALERGAGRFGSRARAGSETVVLIPHRTTCLTLAALPSHFRLYLTLPLPSRCLSLLTVSLLSHWFSSHTASPLTLPLYPCLLSAYTASPLILLRFSHCLFPHATTLLTLPLPSHYPPSPTASLYTLFLLSHFFLPLHNTSIHPYDCGAYHSVDSFTNILIYISLSTHYR